MALPRKSIPVSLALCGANLAVPGAGYLAAGDSRRGWSLFALLNGLFLLGLAFDGTAQPPAALAPGDPLFNIVAVLTFVVQAFHAGGTALVVLAGMAPETLAGRLLARDPGAAFSDLGTFHLLVAGALNYFATVRLFDKLTGEDEAAESSVGKADSAGKASQ